MRGSIIYICTFTRFQVYKDGYSECTCLLQVMFVKWIIIMTPAPIYTLFLGRFIQYFLLLGWGEVGWWWLGDGVGQGSLEKHANWCLTIKYFLLVVYRRKTCAYLTSNRNSLKARRVIVRTVFTIQ